MAHPIHKHMHTFITKQNVKAAIRDDKAHMDYLKRDIKDDQRHGGKYKDENQTADEKHISKLAGDVKYDEKKEGLSRESAYQHAKNLEKYNPVDDRAGMSRYKKEGMSRKGSKPDYIDIDGDGNKTEPMKQAAKGMSRKESLPLGMTKEELGRSIRTAEGKETKKDRRKNKRDTKKTMRHVKKHGSGYESPANMKEKAAVRKQGKGKGKITVRTGGDADPKYVSNRRQKRADKANDGTFKGFTKSAKILDRGRKIKDGSYSSARKGRLAEAGVSRKESDGNGSVVKKGKATSERKTYKKGREISAKAAARKERKGKGRREYATGGGFQGVGKPRKPGHAPGEEHNTGRYVSKKGKVHNIKKAKK